jgi:hypothetical protein
MSGWNVILPANVPGQVKQLDMPVESEANPFPIAPGTNAPAVIHLSIVPGDSGLFLIGAFPCKLGLVESSSIGSRL